MQWVCHNRKWTICSLNVGWFKGNEIQFGYQQQSSAIAEGPRDARSQLKSYQLLHSCMRNQHMKSLQQVNDLEGNQSCRYYVGHI